MWWKLISKLPTSRASHRSALDHNNPGRFCGVKVSPFPADVSVCFSPGISRAGSSPLPMDISWCPPGLRDSGSCKMWDWADICVWGSEWSRTWLDTAEQGRVSICSAESQAIISPKFQSNFGNGDCSRKDRADQWADVFCPFYWA